jgi:hypothetical protein
MPKFCNGNFQKTKDKMYSTRVGDCFDPILDPTPDRNPFWIAIRPFGSRSAIGSQSPTIGLEIVSIRFSIRPLIAIRISRIAIQNFGSRSEKFGSQSAIGSQSPTLYSTLSVLMLSRFLKAYLANRDKEVQSVYQRF